MTYNISDMRKGKCHNAVQASFALAHEPPAPSEVVLKLKFHRLSSFTQLTVQLFSKAWISIEISIALHFNWHFICFHLTPQLPSALTFHLMFQTLSGLQLTLECLRYFNCNSYKYLTRKKRNILVAHIVYIVLQAQDSRCNCTFIAVSKHKYPSEEVR